MYKVIKHVFKDSEHTFNDYKQRFREIAKGISFSGIDKSITTGKVLFTDGFESATLPQIYYIHSVNPMEMVMKVVSTLQT